jgi:FkbM family methyltransferase
MAHIHWFHLRPTALFRIGCHLMCGLRLTHFNIVRFVRFVPDCINSMMTAWNLRQMAPDVAACRTILDVGANRSQMTRLLMTFFDKAVDVYSFEPNPTLNPVGHVFRVALSDHQGQGALSVDADDLWGTLVDEDGNHGPSSGTSRAFPVAVDRFDHLVSSGAICFERLQKPILLKVDTEGHEFRAIMGFGDCLSRIDYILCEVPNGNDASYDLFDLTDSLSTFGFDTSRIVHAASVGSRAPGYCDVLFSRRVCDSGTKPAVC